MTHDDRAAPQPSDMQSSATRRELELTVWVEPAYSAEGPREFRATSDERREIRAILGEGGMGKVYLAYEDSLQREVALKEIASGLASFDDARSAFVREACITARLHHPGVVPVHALTSGPSGAVAFSMQAVQGKNLFAWLHEPGHHVGARERLDRGLEVFLRLCDTLAYAHSRGVLHCDLKPENVMIGEFGSVYLMDWGLARLFDEPPPPGLCGTPAYMAPEQARNEPLDERSDVFGLGGILCEIVIGSGPYGRGEAVECLTRAVKGCVVDVVDAAREVGVSRRLCRIVERAVAPRLDERYPTVIALRDDVRALLQQGFHLPRRALPAGSFLFREGEPGDTAYLIVSGRCRVHRRSDGLSTPPRILGPGDIFGELALLLGEPRTASVEALDDCMLLVIERETIEASGALEGWSAALLHALARRFRELERRIDGA